MNGTSNWSDSPLGETYAAQIAKGDSLHKDAVQEAMVRLLRRYGTAADVPAGYLSTEIRWAKSHLRDKAAKNGLTEVPAPVRLGPTAVSEFVLTDASGRLFLKGDRTQLLSQEEAEHVRATVTGSRETSSRQPSFVVSGSAARGDDSGQGSELLERVIVDAREFDEPEFTAFHYDLASAIGLRMTNEVQSRTRFCVLLLAVVGSLEAAEGDWTMSLDAATAERRLTSSSDGVAALCAVRDLLGSTRTPDIKNHVPFIVLAILRELTEFAPSRAGLTAKFSAQAVGGSRDNGGRSTNARRVARRLLEA